MYGLSFEGEPVHNACMAQNKIDEVSAAILSHLRTYDYEFIRYEEDWGTVIFDGGFQLRDLAAAVVAAMNERSEPTDSFRVEAESKPEN